MFDADALVDRRKLKRRLMVWRGLAILALVAVVAVAVGRFGPTLDSSHIARIEIAGPIVSDQRRLDAIQSVAENPNAKALVVFIDSPGGTVVGGEELYKALRDVSEEKPVVAVMGQLATSAGYMVALGADRIFARDGTITGSIGVILQSVEITGLLDKIGVEPQTIKSSPLKAVPSPLEPLTDEARRVTQALVNDVYEMFVELVVQRRDLSPATARVLSDGRVYTGRMAVGNKLIDALGGQDEAVAWLEEARDIAPNLPVRNVRPARGVEDLFDQIDGIARKTVLSERLTLDGLVSVWHPDLR
jgi:protease-4